MKKKTTTASQGGPKRTSQRRAILQALQRSDKPMTAREVLTRVRRSLPKTGLDTVYRNLLLLVQSGVLAQTHLQNRSASRFEYQAGAHHHHAICLTCGRSFCLQGIPEPTFKGTREDPGFRVEGHLMEFHGTCGSCLRPQGKR